MGPEFLVSTSTTGFAVAPKAALASGGRFVAAWTAPFDPTNELDVVARRFDAGGNGIGNEFMVPTDIAERQWDPDVAIWPDGRFVVVWTDYNHPVSGRVVRGQRYDANGAAFGSAFQVNTDPGDADHAGTRPHAGATAGRRADHQSDGRARWLARQQCRRVWRTGDGRATARDRGAQRR
jgi:hypothetical protein